MSNVTEQHKTDPGLDLSTVVEEEADPGFHRPFVHGMRPRTQTMTGTNPDGTERCPFPLDPNSKTTHRGQHSPLTDQDVQSRERMPVRMPDPSNTPVMVANLMHTVEKSKYESVTHVAPEQATSGQPSTNPSLPCSNNNILPQSPQDLGVIDLTTVATGSSTTPAPPCTISSGQSIVIQSH
ncbi:uncharacterized protein LY79DRAFT_584198 [Colletotrichum navitas]|uniref:Uncharacterized protein n=1 Tax=Colletotrichum navitas TaxID=681940 RepID=A0AAD8UYY7_9PEZI|nr:uncharacterized protein LY79DRAFT_584198 [Colletotrichum navitas]KAK1570212.1 hypothetical protein LY79DRAFT_584198 [Colletotrichum navitas]